MTRDLGRLIRPRSIAVVGGGAWGRAVLRGLKRMKFDGPVMAVHRDARTIEGVTAVAHVSDLPHVPDAVFVGVNRHASIAVLRDLATLGAGGAVCFASGFAEASDGGDLHQSLLDAAGDMPVIGPNCYGFINALEGAALWPDIHGLVPVTRGAAILTQSSNIALNLTMQQRGLPIAFVGTVGNQALIDMAEMGEALLNDPRISTLGLHIEGIHDVAAFERMARTAQRLCKPVIVLKTGRSAAAQIAAISHTASLTGSDAGAAALFARLGIARVNSLEALIEALKLVHVIGPLPANRFAALACSGGEAALVADAGAARGLIFPDLSPHQESGLRESLNTLVTLSNPLDYHTFIWGDAERMALVFAEMMTGDAVLTLLVADFPRPDRCQTDEWEVLIRAAIAAHTSVGMPLAILSSLPDTMPEAMAQRLLEAGLIPLCGIEAAFDALRACVDLGAPVPVADPVLRAQEVPDAVLIDEGAAKIALAQHGLEIPALATVADADAAVAWANGRGAVVLKATGLAHKSDVGGVHLDLRSPADIRAAAASLPAGPMLIEHRIEGAIVELLIGVIADPAHGYVLTLGAGGVQSEIIRDTAHLLLPTTPSAIAEALDSLAIAPMLHGFRGGAAASIDATIRAVLAVQAYVIDAAPHVAEVEINPLIVTATRAVAVDALIRVAAPKATEQNNTGSANTFPQTDKG